MITIVALLLAVCSGLVTPSSETEAQSCVKITLTERQGEINSPNFPDLYYPNTCTMWTLQKPFLTVLTLSFAYLDLPQAEDDKYCHSNYIIVGSANYKQVYCGEKAKSFTSFPYEYDTHFYIKFVSGAFPAGHGFRLEYFVGPWKAEQCSEDQFHCRSGKCIPGHWQCNGRKECEDGDDESCHDLAKSTVVQPLTQRPTTAQSTWYQNLTSHSCNYILHNRTGQFKLLVSPNAAYKRCSWLIDVPGNVDRIKLQFVRLDIYSDASILLYKGRTAGISNCLGMFDGNSRSQSVTAHTSSLLVVFRLAFDDPSSLTRDLYFVAKYSAYAKEYYPSLSQEGSCYHQLYQSVGNFSMPLRSFQSSSIRNCTWHIYKPYAASYIHLLITSLNLHTGENIKVYDGQNELAPSLAVVNRSNELTEPLSLHSSGSHMLVHFTTPYYGNDNAHRWVVFDAKYHFEDICDFAGEMHCGAEDNKCYQVSQNCDGVWDCPVSGTDEEACFLCPTQTYSCGDFGHGRSTKCYLKHDRCSGVSFCPNDADELNCNEALCSESRNLFLCANKRCILYSFICDEHDDCGDNSDEEGCSLGNSRKVMVAAVVGSLLCSLLLVLSLGCACKFYYLRHHSHHTHHPHPRSPRYDTPLSRLQAELFRRRAPPPPYHEAMLTSRPYDEAVREYLAQTQQRRDPESTEQENQDVEQRGARSDSGDSSVQNLISLMDFSQQVEERQEHNINGQSRQLEIHGSSDTSSDSESEREDGSHRHNTQQIEDDLGQIEMTENLGQNSSRDHSNNVHEESLREDVSEDSASATLSADGTEMTSLAKEGEGNMSKAPEEIRASMEAGEESEKDSSDADSVCILCLDEDPAALDDGSDTQCLLHQSDHPPAPC